MIPIRLKIQNVSNEIYDLLNGAGFTDIYDIKKKPREINIENCEKVGDGIMSNVYKIEEGKVVKVFKPEINYDHIIEKENNLSRIAFISGVPTPIAYDIVKVGNSYGNVYEYLDAKTLAVVMENDREHIEDYMKQYTKTLKKVHQIKINTEKSVSIKQESLQALPLLVGEGKILNNEEMEKIKKIFENIPDKTTFIHGDSHPGNIMYKNGEIFLIDLGNGGFGHPMFDLVSMYTLYRIIGPNPEERKKNETVKAFNDEEIKKTYDIFIREYLETEDQNLIEKANKQIQAIACARILFSEIAMPGLIPRPALEAFKGIALKTYDDGLEPICF